jgi:hypothetical protein
MVSNATAATAPKTVSTVDRVTCIKEYLLLVIVIIISIKK